MSAGFSPARITRVVSWSPGLRTITLDRAVTNFQSGQFFQIALTRDGELTKRSYSAASAPGAPLEFFLSRVPGGALTPDVFELQEGDNVELDENALGFFTLSEVPDAETLWLISTGTGLGPWISMLREGRVFERFSRVVVVQGVRTRAELAYADELAAWRDSHSLVHVPVVSREGAPAGGISGRITSALVSGDLETRAGLPVDASGHYLLCGNPEMIEEMTTLFKARGLRKHRRREPGHFNFEKYW